MSHSEGNSESVDRKGRIAVAVAEEEVCYLYYADLAAYSGQQVPRERLATDS